MRRTIVHSFLCAAPSLEDAIYLILIDGNTDSDLVWHVLLLNFYSFYYFGLAVLTGTAFVYFWYKKEVLRKSFLDYQMFLISLFLWSLTWFICNSFVEEWTAYVFVFLKNPAVVVLGTSILSASFRLGKDDFPKLRSIVIRVSYFLGAVSVFYNSWGFFERVIIFDPKLEFYVPLQYSKNPLVQGSIVSIATVVSLQLLFSFFVLGFKFRIGNKNARKQILNFVFAAACIFSLSILNISVDLQHFPNDTYVFLLTNVTFLAVTIVILSALNQEYVPSNVGFKIMTFNITLMYLVLSLIANILFSRYKEDFINDLNREKDFVKAQIEKGFLHPIVYQADIVFNLEDSFFNINKFQKPHSEFSNLDNRIPSYLSFKLEKGFPGPSGLFWMGDFSVYNKHFVIGISYKDYRRKINSIVIWFILTLVATLTTIFLLYPLLHKANVINPLNRLLDGILRMKRGDLNTKIEITTFDEIGIITDSFNEMIGQVRDSKENLELLIRERTEELHKKLIELRNTQSQLLLAERMSTLGRIAAGVAHEINNPLAAIKASSNFLGNYASFSNISSNKTNNEIEQAIHSLLFEKQETGNGSAISKLKRKRELSLSFEQAGFQNPSEISDTCYDLGITELPKEFKKIFSTESARKSFLETLEKRQILFHLKIIESAIDRASKIVFALKHYSYSGPKENKITFNLKQGIDEVLQMYTNVWKQGTVIDVNVDSNINVFGYPDELVQVWTNLIYNSIQATAKISGIVDVYSEINGGMVSVFIKDNGHGISKEHLPSIFEPFFTTKELGMGTGLGLPLVKKIIEAHEGEIFVESIPGHTVFEVRLPIHTP